MVLRPVRAPLLGLLPAPLAAAELPRGHIPALDAIRGLAILAVTLYRFGGCGEGPARAIDHPALIELGSRGVDLFFVLSGFLITGILTDAKGKAHYFLNFYVRRALRIFPLYYATLAVTLLILPLGFSSLASDFRTPADNQLWLWLYGANVLQAYEGRWCLGPLNHFWSLAIEEHFYLLWPAVIYCTSRTAAMRICALVFVASVVARAAWLACGGNDVAAYVLTPLRMDGLVLGSWLALAARCPGGLARLAGWAAPALLLFGAAAASADLLDRRLFGLPIAVWSCACGAFLIAAVAARPDTRLARFGQSSVLQFLGKYSYAIYVFQLPLVYLLAPLVTAPRLAETLGSPVLGQAAYCVLLSAGTVLCAVASWNLFEKRVLTLKHRFGN